MKSTRITFVGSEEKTWLTPPELIKSLGEFDTDPCVPDDMPWRTAKRMITKTEDGLACEWIGRVWLNPPYGLESIPFLRKMASHNGGGCALIPSRTDTAYFHDIICASADALFFIRGRLRFFNKNLVRGDSSPFPSMLVSYSRRDTDAIIASGLKGTLARLKTE